jgi:hypothetical protein
MFNTHEETIMTQPVRHQKPKTDELPKELVELVSAIGALPTQARVNIDPLLARVVDSSRRRRRILHLVQDALSQLRLDMKYLMFDLEATRRERDAYRSKLEDA